MTFEEFANYMFIENCIEKKAWGEKPYANVSEYFSAGTNSSFLIHRQRQCFSTRHSENLRSDDITLDP